MIKEKQNVKEKTNCRSPDPVYFTAYFTSKNALSVSILSIPYLDQRPSGNVCSVTLNFNKENLLHRMSYLYVQPVLSLPRLSASNISLYSGQSSFKHYHTSK